MDFAADNGIKYLSTECGFIPEEEGSMRIHTKRIFTLHESMAYYPGVLWKEMFTLLWNHVIRYLASAKRSKGFYTSVWF